MFYNAKAIFARGMDAQLNVHAVFEATLIGVESAQIHICAADFYRLYLNGKFIAFGPARTAKGFAREDVIDLGALDGNAEYKIEIAVVGYNCCSLSTVRQTPFLMAEVQSAGAPVLWTGRDFECYLPENKIQKTERYSVQRHFCEVWDLRRTQRKKVDAQVIDATPAVIDRVAPYPTYEQIYFDTAATVGELKTDADACPRANFYSYMPSERWGRFEYDDIEYHSYEWIQTFKQLPLSREQRLPVHLDAGQYAIFDLARMQVGFFKLCVSADKDSHVVLAFSEDCSAEHFDFTDMHTHNVMDVVFEGGKRSEFESFEPYVSRYAIVALKSGSISLESFGIREYAGDVSSVKIPDLEDGVLKNIYESAVRTYAHNALDLYTDCPSRERAGWLCDSFFTAKTEYALFGTTRVEDAFLENYRLFRNEGEYPEGVLPMCYPSEPKDTGDFIPQWNMWYIIEAEDYINNRGHGDARELFRKSIFDLLAFFEKYENSDGLLEKLPSWNFVEWSRANGWTQDVSYPSNFLYAEVLDSVYRIYGDEKYAQRAQKVRRTAVAQSFDGRVFLDHAVRTPSGELEVLSDCSEACQYYAILFAGIDMNAPEYAELRSLVLEKFGADRTEMLDEIAPINAFIGAYLRLEALLKMGENERALSDVRAFFGNMGQMTGTLWEYRERHGSRDHGFASYALVVIRRVLGIE